MKMAKNVIVLTVITVISGFLLGFVYDLTKEPIAAADLAAKQAACKAVFPEAADFNYFDVLHAEILLESQGFTQESYDEGYIARDSAGEVLGYVFTISTKEGYGSGITLSMGIGNDGIIKGIEFLSIAETPGLGMNATKDEFKSQFIGLPAGHITYTKTGKSDTYEIDAISGATITTNAVTRAVNAGCAIFYDACAGGNVNEQ